jgi:inositol-1,3,4-trisphosphate 5/6-kinase/inositol-tetrakisphosphate 1-kinase
MSNSLTQQHATITIGYAIPAKKEPTFLLPSLHSYAAVHGVEFRRIDPGKPLIDQGPFDCVVHKIYDQDWNRNLKNFSSQNPSVPIIDSPHSIEKIHYRDTMLDVVPRVKLTDSKENVVIPKQTFVYDEESLKSAAKQNFPVIAKPIEANGSDYAHKMQLVYDDEGLKNVKAPVVLQEFVNHGGVVFKVYVAGEYVRCVKRQSLPDVKAEMELKGSVAFELISNVAPANDVVVVMPAEEFVAEVARGLRKEMGLNLFNFDMIRDGGKDNRYVVIDINYFPGYAKMPDYEPVMTQFFLDVVKTTKKKQLNCCCC